jgi:hypothetical protein
VWFSCVSILALDPAAVKLPESRRLHLLPASRKAARRHASPGLANPRQPRPSALQLDLRCVRGKQQGLDVRGARKPPSTSFGQSLEILGKSHDISLGIPHDVSSDRNS